MNAPSTSDIYAHPIKVALESLRALREENERLRETIKDMRFHVHLALNAEDEEDRRTAMHDALDAGREALK
jgi:hypothetical protein